MLVRQAHPGPNARPYDHFEQKLRDAQTYQRDENIAWPVLVDDIAGTVHQVYGTMADPTYLIDADGRVAYYNMWTHAPTLNNAIETLLAQNGRGVVRGAGVDRVPHLLPSMTDGWKGLRRGWPQSFVDMETATPGVATSTWLGYQLRPLLAPLTLRAEPLPAPVRIGLAVGAAAALFLWMGRRRATNGTRP